MRHSASSGVQSLRPLSLPRSPCARFAPGGLAPRSEAMLKGLVWCCAGTENDAVVRGLGALLEAALRPKVSARAIAGACARTLGTASGAGATAELVRLDGRVRAKPVRREIDAALESIALCEGITREELEERAIADFGWQEVGRHAETLGEANWSITIDDSKVDLSWSVAGNARKAPPAALAKSEAERVKAVRALRKDVERVVTSVRDRLDARLMSARTWTLEPWRVHLLSHPHRGHRRAAIDLGVRSFPAAKPWAFGMPASSLGSTARRSLAFARTRPSGSGIRSASQRSASSPGARGSKSFA